MRFVRVLLFYDKDSIQAELVYLTGKQFHKNFNKTLALFSAIWEYNELLNFPFWNLISFGHIILI